MLRIILCILTLIVHSTSGAAHALSHSNKVRTLLGESDDHLIYMYQPTCHTSRKVLVRLGAKTLYLIGNRESCVHGEGRETSRVLYTWINEGEGRALVTEIIVRILLICYSSSFAIGYAPNEDTYHTVSSRNSFATSFLSHSVGTCVARLGGDW